MQIFGKQSCSQNARKGMKHTLVDTLHNMPWGSDQGSQEQDMRGAPTMPQMQHPYYTLQIGEFVNYIYMSLWLILLQCK